MARILAPILVLVACSPDPAVVSLDGDPACDPLAPLECALPWPSDRYLVADASTETGFRVRYPREAMPADAEGDRMDPGEYSRADGMPVSSRLLVRFDRTPDLGSVAFHDDIGRSLAPDHPIVVVDRDTGERLPHWAELDAEQTDGPPTLIVSFTASLDADASYGVAIRGLKDLDGEPLEPSVGFRALRDGTPSDHDELESRRSSYEALFDDLDQAGVKRDGLQLAWWFHTASEDYMHRDLLTLRERYLEALGPDGLGCEVLTVEDDWEADSDYPMFRRVTGRFTVPNVLDDPKGLAPRLLRDANDAPMVEGTTTMPFTLHIPYSAADGTGPATLLAYGHGLMATGDATISNEMFRNIGENNRYIVVATDWYGMSTPDVATVSLALTEPSAFVHTAEKLMPGMLHWTALTRTFTGVCHDLPELSLGSEPLIDTDRVFYAGGSQGGIFGATALALHPDVHRGVLLVGGANMPFLMDRSWDFLPYEPVLTQWYPRRADQLLGLELTSHWWDWTDPIHHLPHLADGHGLTPPKQVLSVVALNDVQVTNLGSDIAARTAGWPVIDGSARVGWGLDTAAPGTTDSGYITVNLGDRAGPQSNAPPTVNDKGHSTIGWPESVQQILGNFLRPGGEITVPCDGICDPD